MWSIGQSLLKAVNLKLKSVNIDNHVFKLHYRVTFSFLLLCSALLWGNDFFDNSIKCTQGRSSPDEYKPGEDLDKALGRWCYVRGIFTVPRHFVKNFSNSEIIYPGVGPIIPTDTEQKLYWYQWVAVVLLIQAVCFYIPHGMWKMYEKKTIAAFVEGFGFAEFLTDNKKRELLNDVKSSMVHRIPLMGFWAKWMIPCEALNLVNVIAQWCINDWFLGGSFSKLGTASHDANKGEFNPMDVYFPKVAKCTYNKFGPTGEIFNLDILCILTQNILHEKIYLFLWYWFVFLIIITSMNMIYRLVALISHRYKKSVNAKLYLMRTSHPPDMRDLDLVMGHFNYGEWLFLAYLLDNCDDHLASEIISSIANTLRISLLLTFIHLSRLKKMTENQGNKGT